MENETNHISINKIILIPLIAFFTGIPIAFGFIIAASTLHDLVYTLVKYANINMYIFNELSFIIGGSLSSLLLGYLAGVILKNFPKWMIFLTIPLIIPIIGCLLFFEAVAAMPHIIPISFWIFALLPFYIFGLIIYYFKK